jgi:hypothetical protein
LLLINLVDSCQLVIKVFVLFKVINFLNQKIIIILLFLTYFSCVHTFPSNDNGNCLTLVSLASASPSPLCQRSKHSIRPYMYLCIMQDIGVVIVLCM